MRINEFSSKDFILCLILHYMKGDFGFSGYGKAGNLI